MNSGNIDKTESLQKEAGDEIEGNTHDSANKTSEKRSSLENICL